MDLRNYLAVLVRRKWQILVITLLTVLVSTLSTLFLLETKYGATLYFTIASRDDKITDYYDFGNYYGNMASIEFARTVSGWHENPQFKDDVYNKAGISINEDLDLLRKLIGPFSVKRIERANIKVGLNSKTLASAERLAQSYVDILEERLEHYNQVSDTQYNLAESSRILYAKEPKLGTNIPIAIFIGLILGIIFAYLYEYFARVVSSKDQAEEILGRKACEVLNKKFSFSDLAFLSSYVKKLPHSNTVIAGLSVESKEISSKLALQLAGSEENYLLVDADLDKKHLHQSFKESRKAKKGYTETDSKDLDKLVQEIEKGKLSVLPAGRDDKFPRDFFGKLTGLRKFKGLLVHTLFPKYVEVLNSLKPANLILIVKLGQSKTSDLQKMREFLEEEKVHLVILK